MPSFAALKNWAESFILLISILPTVLKLFSCIESKKAAFSSYGAPMFKKIITIYLLLLINVLLREWFYQKKLEERKVFQELAQQREILSTKQVEWAKLTSPDHLKKLAKKYGLVPPVFSSF